MITTEDVLSLNFYKKEKFTGSYRGMRYLLEKSKDEEDADIFRCHIWPGPYNYASTPDEKKKTACFPFTEEGKKQAVDWMNDEWSSHTDWPHL
uniref:GNAT family acetyltransferase n=1 Tax=Roseburia sp. TaxID=2049040 RepID=UPI003FF083A0